MYDTDISVILWGHHYDLHLRKFLFHHLSITSEFADIDIKDFETLGEIGNHLLDQCFKFHGSNICIFEDIKVEFTGFFIMVLGKFVENCQHSYICL